MIKIYISHSIVQLNIAGHEASANGLGRMKGQKKANKQKSRGISGGKKKNKGRTTCSETPYTDPIGWPGLSVTSVDLTEATRLNFRLDPDWTPRLTSISEVVNGQTPSKYDLAIEPGKQVFKICLLFINIHNINLIYNIIYTVHPPICHIPIYPQKPIYPHFFWP